MKKLFLFAVLSLATASFCPPYAHQKPIFEKKAKGKTVALYYEQSSTFPKDATPIPVALAELKDMQSEFVEQKSHEKTIATQQTPFKIMVKCSQSNVGHAVILKTDNPATTFCVDFSFYLRFNEVQKLQRNNKLTPDELGKLTPLKVDVCVYGPDVKIPTYLENFLKGLLVPDSTALKTFGKIVGAGALATLAIRATPIITKHRHTHKIDRFAQELADALSQRTDLFPSGTTPTLFVGKADITNTWGTPTTNTTLDVSGPGKADIVVVSALSSEGKNHFFSSPQFKKDSLAEQIKVLVVATSDFYPFSETEIRKLNTYGWTCVLISNSSSYYSFSYSSYNHSSLFINATNSTTAQDIAVQITDKRKPYLKGLGLTVEASEHDYQQRAVKFSDADTANPAHNEALIEIRRNLARYASPDAVKMAFAEKAGAIQARMDHEAVLAEEKRRKDAAAQAAAVKAANIERCKNYVVPVMDFLQEHTVALFNSPQPTGSGAGEGTTSRNDNKVTVNRQFAAKPDDEHGHVVDFSELNAGKVNQVLIIGAPFPGTIDHLRTTGILEADTKLQQIKIIVIPLTTLNQEEITPDLQAIFMNYKWHVIFVNDDQKTFNDMFPVVRSRWYGSQEEVASTWNTLIEKNNQWFKGFVWMNTDRSTDLSWHIFTGHNWSPTFRRINLGRECDSPIADTRDTVLALLDNCTVDSFPNDLAAAVERRLTSAQSPRLCLWSRGRQTSREDTASLNRLRRASAHSRRKLFHTQQQFEEAEERLLMERCKKIAQTSPEEYLGFKRGSNPSRDEIERAYQAAKDSHSGSTAEDGSSSTPPPNGLLLYVDLAYKILTDDEYYKFIYGKTKEELQKEADDLRRRQVAAAELRAAQALAQANRIAQEEARRVALEEHYRKNPHLRPRLMTIPA